MNKTKRTLLFSSLIMALALVVTIVSVSAAWFSDSASSENGGFLIGSDTVSEYASIKIDSSITGGEGGYSIWPAKAVKGWLLNNSGTAKKAPFGSVLKTSNATLGIQEGAKCAYIYFPITFIGAGDVGYADGNKSLKLTLNSVRIDKYTTFTKNEKNESVVDTFTDFIDEFFVEMRVVVVDRSDEDNIVITAYENGNINSLASEQIYYNQPFIDGNPTYDLYMAIDAGVEYYIEACVYFNKIDEEVNIDLLYTSIYLNFAIDFNVTREQLIEKTGGSLS